MSQKKSLKRKHAEEETYKKQQKLINMNQSGKSHSVLDEPVYVVHYPGFPNHDEEVLQCEAFERFMPATEAYVQKAKAIYDKVKKETAEKKRGKRRSCRPKGVINKT
uniref:Uncharacterized protein n=1 Tax=Ditylenchus dipsaci TaxID=166011 RepID=A0A915ENV0_9BILA